jgi:hypothetical protein
LLNQPSRLLVPPALKLEQAQKMHSFELIFIGGQHHLIEFFGVIELAGSMRPKSLLQRRMKVIVSLHDILAGFYCLSDAH